ncbi:hypothetical protein [Bacillus paramycoides]|uniref:hypothetical protein n=1 Tax=Bacillus paramycoides TaxID=2026194 RepID=UPI00380926DD
MPYLKNGCFFIIRSFFIIFGIIAICSLPQLFFGKSPNSSNSLAMQPTPTLQFNLSNYLDSILNVISSLFHPTTITYKISNAGIQSPNRDLFPYLLESYNHTLIIMICAFLIAVLLSTTFTILTFYFPKHIQTIILKILHVLEALPDLFFVVCVQLFVIWINQQMLQTLVLLLNLALFQTISFNVAGTLVLLGHNHQFLNVLPWVAFGPVLFFTIVILAVYMMLSGMQHALKNEMVHIDNSLLLSALSKEKSEKRNLLFSFKQRFMEKN